MSKLPDRLSLARTPTPLEPLKRLSASTGHDLWIKRDDLTGGALSGNKIRKLEFLLADARALGADIILTAGAWGSNHCRASAFAARRVGLDTHLLLWGEPPEEPTGNLQLDELVGATWSLFPPEERRTIEDRMAEKAAELQAEGRRPYCIPTGGSNPLGSLGYVLAVEEIARAVTRGECPSPQHIVCACGSGGTVAGVALGVAHAGLHTQVHGVTVVDSAAYFRPLVGGLIEAARARWLPETPLPPTPNLVDGYKGARYGARTESGDAALRRVAREEAVLLDPVYTAKAFAGMLAEMESWSPGPVLFLHTGGAFALFQTAGNPYAEA